MKIIYQSPNRRISHSFLKRLFLPLLFIFFSFVGNAQERTVTGKITDATDSSPVAGVTVRVKGTERGTTTNAAGGYRISIKENDILQFSFIGFAPKEVQVGSKSTIDVVLQEDITQLQEQVVTALGISKEKRSISNAVQTVQGVDLIKAREPNSINSLAGKVAGLTIGASAELLGRPKVLLRGNEDVLYVVDGVPKALLRQLHGRKYLRVELSRNVFQHCRSR